MSQYNPAYKLTVYKSAADDPTELSAMVPVAGAIHSDAFSVTTLPSLGGFKPYLGLPQGRKNTYDPTSGKVTNQDLNFRLLDMKSGTSGGNLQRWVTAFVGNNSGSMNLINRRVEVWESLDGGSSWNAFYEGRISDAKLDDPLWYSISIKSRIDDLNVEAFKHRPAAGITGYAQTSLIPMGLSDQYGPFSASAALNTTFTITGGSGSMVLPIDIYPNGLSTVLTGYLQRGIKTVSAAQAWIARTFGQDTSEKISLTDPSGSAGSNFRLLVTSGSTTGEFVVKDLTFELHTAAEKNKNVVYRVKSLRCVEVPTTDPAYKTLATFSGKAVTVRLVPNAERLTDTNPLFISGKHPGRLIRELASGSYGYLDEFTRAPKRQVISYDSASFAAFESSSYYGGDLPRFKITKPIKINDFIEKYLCPLGVGYRVDHVVSASHVISQLSVFDSRIPASSSFASLPALTDVDVATTDFSWQVGIPVSSITVKYYTEYMSFVDSKTLSSNDIYDLDPWLLSEADTSLIEIIPENIASTTKTVTIDALGSRSPSANRIPFGRLAFGQDRSHLEIANYQVDRFAQGPPSIDLKCRRTSTVNGLKLGQWVLVNVSLLPDPTSHQRGGVRLCQVTEKSEDGLFINLSLSDAGKNVLNLAPSIGTVVAGPSVDGTLSANVPVTAITNQKLLLQMAEVPSGSARPVEIDPSWFTVVRRNVTVGTAVNYLVSGLRNNQTYWFRARTSTLDDSLPSVWAYSAAGYTLGILTAPTSLTYSNITAESARVAWNNAGDNASDVLITLASPSSSQVLNTVGILYPGSTFYELSNLSNAAANNPYLVGVTHINGGAASATSTIAFSLSASLGSCPNMAGLRVYGPAYSSGSDVGGAAGQPYSLTGVPLLLTPSSLEYDVEVQRAPDVAGAAGTYTSLDIIGRGSLSLGGYLYEDFLPLDGTKYWYEARHVRNGFNSGSFIAAVTGSAGKLNATVTAPTTADLPPGVALPPGTIIDYTPFASSLTIIKLVSVLPGAGAFEGEIVYNTTDGKLYRWHSGAWTAAVPTVDLTGLISGSQLVDAAVTSVKLAAAAVVSASIAVGAITAPHISASFGGGNQFYDSSFERNDNTYWDLYNNGPESATLTFPTTAPYRQARSAKVTWSVTNTSTKGVYAATGNVVWKPNTTYVVSWYAKVTTPWAGGMNLVWNIPPTTTTTILNPNLSATYQRYAYRIRWGASVDANFYISISGAATANDLFIDCVQAEEGEVLTAYAPKTDEILPSTITVTEIADNAITTPKLIANAVTAGKVDANAITAREIVANSISGSNIAANTITSANIGANAIVAGQIAAGAVTASTIAAGAIVAGNIAAGAVTASCIAAGAVTTTTMTANSINGDRILANSLSASAIIADSITAGQIQAGAITAAEISAGAITTSKLAIGTGGAALNSDPGPTDIAAWEYIGGTGLGAIVSLTDGRVGGKALRGQYAEYVSHPQPYDPTKSYRVRCWARRDATANGTLYVGIGIRDHSGALIGPSNNFIYIAASAVTPSTSWQEYSGVIPASYGGFVGTPETMQAVILLDYLGTLGYHEAQDIRLEEVIPGSLIVDGTITAAKIAVGTITADKIVAHSITSDQTQGRNRVRVSTTGGTSVATGGSFTPIIWDTETYDSNAIHAANGSRFTIPTGGDTGVWLFTCCFGCQTGTGTRTVIIAKNSNTTSPIAITQYTAGSNLDIISLTGTDDSPTVGDYYEVAVAHTGGSSSFLPVNIGSAFFSATHLW